MTIETKILDGRAVANKVLESVRIEAGKFSLLHGRKPGLAVIHAGADPASAVYVRNKEKACIQSGIKFTMIDLSSDVQFKDILAAIDKLNQNPECDGLIVQLPLPSPEMKESQVIKRIAIDRDVDGFHPQTMGDLWSGVGDIAPCTPAGIIELLNEYSIDIEGKRAVIIGRSNIVGKPMAALLLHRHATVTIAHSRTHNLKELCAEADILVAAIGKPGMIRGDFIKLGAVVIDVGINRIHRDDAKTRWLDQGTKIGRKLEKKGYALIGDVDPVEVMGRAAYYTPVPGGVGRMTVAMLLKNTILLANRRKEGA
ncbi:bifunctional 5,10-methylenetetrahydrofolate dehydrogenase/5,10-methenyltetrahydrofolate cyclohydrolase [bacterium]|nr:bifunctional 5,10-methylenetetrahydrofolate dehydrogenase/5,10-methenyltetrahydrofolate cyclohydrolase [bacterium]